MKTKRENLAHVCNLIQMALVDNDFNDEEMQAILKIATRLGISPSELDETLRQGELKLNIPNDVNKRIEQLHDLVTVMVTDNFVQQEELKYISKLLKVYGFEEVFNSKSIEIDSDYIIENQAYREFFNKFEKYTGNKLSQVVVENNYNISFPFYGTSLNNLSPLPKTLYIFFLLQDKPISLAEISDEKNVNLLKKIYSKVTDTEYYLDDKISSLIDMSDGFNRNRSILKRALKDAIPKSTNNIIGLYEISGKRGQPKWICLDKELIKVIPDFKD
jgi:hypothetical protein